MYFIQQITSWLARIANFFYSGAIEVDGWVWPFNMLGGVLYDVAEAFDHLVYYFIDFGIWVATIEQKVETVLDQDDILSFLGTWLTYAENAWAWVYRAWTNVYGIVNTWWDSTAQVVKVWIGNVKSDILSIFDTLSHTVALFHTEWDDFFTLTLPHLVDAITVDDLIRSWFTELSPAWAGWVEMRDQVVTFFTAPLDWLWDRFTDWFLGGE